MSAEQLEIIAPAVVIGVLVALVHAPLGIEVLKRGIVFIDLAIAQIAGLTIVLTGVLMHGTTPVARDAIAIGAAVAAAAFFRWVEKALPNEQEAVIGSCFIVAASATLLALVNHPHGGEEIQHILSGQILLASWPEIARTAPLLAGVLVLWIAVPRLRRGLGFFLMLAIAVTGAVKLVGVYVVFASLILPALAVNKHRCHPHAVTWASLIALGAVVGGLLVSTITDMPAGPVLVGAYALGAIIFRLAACASVLDAR